MVLITSLMLAAMVSNRASTGLAWLIKLSRPGPADPTGSVSPLLKAVLLGTPRRDTTLSPNTPFDSTDATTVRGIRLLLVMFSVVRTVPSSRRSTSSTNPIVTPPSWTGWPSFSPALHGNLAYTR